MKNPLQEKLEGYVPRRFHVKKITHTDETVKITHELTIAELTRLLDLYKSHGREDQTARLWRDSMDHWIRRYHGYCVVDEIGSHYKQVGLEEKGILEHVIPLSNVRTLMINEKLTIDQALNAPMCRISTKKDVELRKSGLVNTTPDLWNFFHRYRDLSIQIADIDGNLVDLDTWTLQDHYNKFL
jgi:hypothetical protein